MEEAPGLKIQGYSEISHSLGIGMMGEGVGYRERSVGSKEHVPIC